MMAGKFELFKDAGGKFRFRLKAANGEIILASEAYGGKGGAENGVQSVRENAPHDERYERLESSSGQPYFNLKAANSQVIGTSEMYSSPSARDKGIDSVKNNAPTAKLSDLT